MSVRLADVLAPVRIKKKLHHQGICFWCGIKLDKKRCMDGVQEDNKATIDHLISLPLRQLLYGKLVHSKIKVSETLKHKLENTTCKSCYRCNQLRCSISDLLSKLLRKRQDILQYPKAKLSMDKWFKQRCLLFPVASLFRQKIKEKLSEDLATLCLQEIDEIFPNTTI